MKKIIMVVPHLSTGGLPQYTLRMIERMHGEYEVWCVEWDNITGGVLVVQRNKIEMALPVDRFVSLGEDKKEFIRLIDQVEPDIVHFQEIPETFVTTDILDAVYWENRSYEIVVTTHSSYTNPDRIRYGADRFVLVSDWSRRRFCETFGADRCTVWQYPTETIIYDKDSAKERLGFDPDKKHVLHVGLFTHGKNQGHLFEVARMMQDLGYEFHFVGNQADNFRDYWQPLMADKPENCHWHGERSNVGDFYKAADVFAFPSLFELNPLSLIEAKSHGLPLVIRNLDTYDGKYDGEAFFIGDDVDTTVQQILLATKTQCEQIYQDLQRNDCAVVTTDPTISVDFIEGPRVSISDAPGDVFDVTFTDAKTGIVHFYSEIGNGCWAKSNLRYAVDWVIKAVRRSDGKIFETRFNPTGKRIYVALESKSLGDTLAWFPQVEEFRKRWGCQVVCSTFWNSEFEANYPEIEFVHPGAVVNGIYAMFLIGWFFGEPDHNPQMHPRDFKKLPLGQTAADILGIEYVQTRAIMNTTSVTKKRRVGLGVHSTAQSKYWNNRDGWQRLTDFLIKLDYEVIILSNEGDGYMGNSHPTGATTLPPGNFETLKSEMLACDIFVGLGSGLSWLAWTLGVKTVLISGFSRPESEFEGTDVIRIFNEEVCNGCYNRHRFNPGDWNWCPDHKDTDRQFECTKSITANKVISEMIENGWLSF